MENIQINGQKIKGPPKDWVGPPPPHGTEVFIKNLPEDVFEDELFYLFSTMGNVYEVRLPVYWSGKNKGFAFVRYTNVSEADAALEKLNQRIIRPGWPIKIERSLDNTRLFLSSLPNEKTAEEIKSDLSTVVDNIKKVYVYPALENPTTFRGYAFVEFVSHRDAAIAKRILTPDVLMTLFERKCVAAWANPLPFLNQETLKSINILFMRNVPSNTKSIAIKMAVDRIISPDSVHKVKRLNDYAFLTFKNHEIAERAMIKIKSNPFLLGMKAAHVEWAIPRELVNSFSSKEIHMEKDDLSELNLEPNFCVSKVAENYETGSRKLITDAYFSCLDTDNIENNGFRTFQNNADVRMLKKWPLKTESLPLYSRTGIFSQFSSEAKFQNYFHHNELNKSIDLNNFLRDISNQNCKTEDQRYSPEFHSSGSEYNYGTKLKNCFQSLAVTDQYMLHTVSPTWPSPSTSSDMSSK